MEFRQLQAAAVDTARRYGVKNSVEIDEQFALAKLFEEVGEFAQAALIHGGQCRRSKRVSKEESKYQLGRELADVVGMAMLNAQLYGIDLERAIREKWIEEG